jgi:hypothetical protein
MRSVFTFFTSPYIDRYPVDVNYAQGFRSPVYVEGIQGNFFKDRQQYYNVWPRFPTQFQIGGETLTGVITAIAQPTNPTSITSVAHGLTTGAVITVTGVVGMTELNGNDYVITVVDANTFTLDGVDNTFFVAYISGGAWATTNQFFEFTIPGPFLSREVVIGGVDTNGAPLRINDNGDGVLQLLTPNPVVSIPPQSTNPAVPGMYNKNTGNPGLNNPVNIGSVNYVTGDISFTLPPSISLGTGEVFTVWVSQYQTGRPYSLLFWNNEITIRPVPKLVHKIEIEVYLTPVQFMESTDVPILNQWAQYLAYIASREILRDRGDFAAVDALGEGFARQEALVLERQSVEEIGVPNYQMFNSTQPFYINGGLGNGWY